MFPDCESIPGSSLNLLYAFSQSLSRRVGLSEIFQIDIGIGLFSELGWVWAISFDA
jgi:hypothetical protein